MFIRGQFTSLFIFLLKTSNLEIPARVQMILFPLLKGACDITPWLISMSTRPAYHWSPGDPTQIFYDWGGGGWSRGSYFIPKKIPTSEFVYPKKSLHFWHTPKNPTPAVNCAYVIVDLSWWNVHYPKKNPCIFFATQKNPCVFHRPQKIAFGQNCRLKISLPPPPPSPLPPPSSSPSPPPPHQ